MVDLQGMFHLDKQMTGIVVMAGHEGWAGNVTSNTQNSNTSREDIIEISQRSFPILLSIFPIMKISKEKYYDVQMTMKAKTTTPLTGNTLDDVGGETKMKTKIRKYFKMLQSLNNKLSNKLIKI